MPRSLAALLVLVAALAYCDAAAAACPDRPVKQAFKRFLDPAPYELAPDGGFETGASRWTFDGPAGTTAGNEPYFLNKPSDSRSLALSAGGVATSAPMCVSLEHLTVRFMARSTGSPLGILTASAVVRTGKGLTDVIPMGVVSGFGRRWRPSLPLLLGNGLGDSLLEGSARVRFRFAVTGFGGAFGVDEVFVDPYQRG